MRLMLEMPDPYLPRLSPLTDADFALAHRVLEDEKYAQFYRQQSDQGRFVLLDNSFHELGHPLTPSELCRAADICKPSIVIAPDRLGDFKFTLDSFWETRSALPQTQDIAVVLCGASPAERTELFMKTKGEAAMLCLPFKEPRFEWFCDLIDKIPKYVRWPPRIHLLGVNELHELRMFREKFEELGVSQSRCSVDTAKPAKFALLGKKLDEVLTLRNVGSLAEITAKAKPETLETALNTTVYNIALLRKYV